MMQWRHNLTDVRAARQRLEQARGQCVHDSLQLRARVRQRPAVALGAGAVTGYLIGWLTADAQASALRIWRHPLRRVLWRWLSSRV